MRVALTLKNWFQIPASDESLMMQYAESQDQGALKTLYNRHSDNLYHFLLALTSPALAEEISQRTWLQVIEKRHRYRAHGRFQAWLFTLGRHLLLDELRQSSKFADTGATEPVVSDSCIKEAEHQHRLIQLALKSLPFEQREAFCLQQEGFGIQEIATMCDCKTETIKSRLRYARQALRVWLEENHV